MTRLGRSLAALFVTLFLGAGPPADADGDPLPDGAVLRLGSARWRPGSPVRSVAFTPDGKRLVSAQQDVAVWDVATGRCLAAFDNDRGPAYQVLVWDVTQLRPSALPTLDAAAFAKLWDRLAGADAADAFRAVLHLAADPARGVPLLRERLKPVEPADAATVARLIADLDNPRFAAREAAFRELQRLGETALGDLEKASGSGSPEVRRQAERLIKQASDEESTADRLRALRAVEALELARTAGAERLLAEWAKGAPGATLTREARAALTRLRPDPRGAKP